MRRISISLLFLGVMTALFFGLCAHAPTQGGKPIPLEVQKRLDALKKQIANKNLTFTVGHSRAAERPLQDLCGFTKTPANVKEVAAQQNAKAAPKLAADHKARDEFVKKTKDTPLPGLSVKPRVEWGHPNLQHV